MFDLQFQLNIFKIAENFGERNLASRISQLLLTFRKSKVALIFTLSFYTPPKTKGILIFISHTVLRNLEVTFHTRKH